MRVIFPRRSGILVKIINFDDLTGQNLKFLRFWVKIPDLCGKWGHFPRRSGKMAKTLQFWLESQPDVKFWIKSKTLRFRNGLVVAHLVSLFLGILGKLDAQPPIHFKTGGDDLLQFCQSCAAQIWGTPNHSRHRGLKLDF